LQVSGYQVQHHSDKTFAAKLFPCGRCMNIVTAKLLAIFQTR